MGGPWSGPGLEVVLEVEEGRSRNVPVLPFAVGPHIDEEQIGPVFKEGFQFGIADVPGDGGAGLLDVEAGDVVPESQHPKAVRTMAKVAASIRPSAGRIRGVACNESTARRLFPWRGTPKTRLGMG